jgi:hypothetical protein
MFGWTHVVRLGAQGEVTMAKRLGALLAVTVLVVSLSGCWLQPGFDPGRSNWNDGEAAITAANVGQLQLQWQGPVPGVPVASFGGAVYTVAGGSLSALTASTGELRWTADIPTMVGVPNDSLFSMGVVVAGADPWVAWQYIGTRFPRSGLLHLDRATGTLVVDPDAPSGGLAAPPSVVDDRPVASSWGWISPDPGGQGGAGIYWTYQPTVLFGAAPNFGRNFAIVGQRVLWSQGTQATGFSPACPSYGDPYPTTWCAPDWTTELGATPTGVARIGTDQVAYTDDSGTLSILDVADGHIAWSAETGSGTIIPTVAGATIFLRTNGQLVAYPATGCGGPTCSPQWTASLGTGLQPALAAGDVVYVIDGTNTLAFPRDGCAAATCNPIAALTGIRTTLIDNGQLFGIDSAGTPIVLDLPPIGTSQ